MQKKVVTKGGGKNLYYIRESGGKFYAYKDESFSDRSVGSAGSMEDALSLIKADSGKEIESIG